MVEQTATMTPDQELDAFEAWLEKDYNYDDLNSFEINMARDAWQARAGIEAERQARGEPVAKVKVQLTGGNAGIHWHAVAVNNYDSLPLLREGTLLFTAPQPQQIPEGYKIVPKEPTSEMLKAAQTVWLNDPMRRTTTFYQAMLAAAPKPEEQS